MIESIFTIILIHRFYVTKQSLSKNVGKNQLYNEHGMSIIILA